MCFSFTVSIFSFIYSTYTGKKKKRRKKNPLIWHLGHNLLLNKPRQIGWSSIVQSIIGQNDVHSERFFFFFFFFFFSFRMVIDPESNFPQRVVAPKVLFQYVISNINWFIGSLFWKVNTPVDSLFKLLFLKNNRNTWTQIRYYSKRSFSA